MGILSNSLYVYSAFLYLNFLVYIFHSIIGRSIGKEGYGEFNVVYSFMFAVGYLASILSTLSIKIIVENYSRRQEYLQSMRLRGFLFGLILALTAFFLSEYLCKFLKVNSINYFYIVGVSWLVLFPMVVEKSYLQVTGRFGLFALMNGLEMTLRVLFVMIAIYSGLKVEGGLLAYFFGILSIEIILLSINRGFNYRISPLSSKKLLKIALYTFPNGFFIFADDLFIRRIFSPDTAGLYASVSVVGKFLLWSVVALMEVFFPKFVEMKNDISLRRYLLQIFAISVFFEFLFQLLFLLFGKSFFLLIYGESFAPAYDYVPQYLFSILPFIFVLIFVNLCTAIEKGILIVYLNLILFYSGFFIFNFTTVKDYLLYLFAIHSVFVVIYLCFYRYVFMAGKK